MNKKQLAITYLILGLCLIAFILSKNTSHQGFRVGVVLPSTGKFSSISEDIKNGLTLAKEKSGQGAVDLFFEDSAGEPQKGISAAINLIENMKVDALLLGTGSTVNIAVAPVTEKYKKPLFVISATPQLMEKDDFVFTLQPSIKREVSRAVDLSKEFKAKTVSVIYDSSSDTLTEAASMYSVAFGEGNVTKEGHQKNLDYKTVAAKAIFKKPDLIYVLTVDKIAGPIVKNIRDMGYKGNIIGFSGAESDEFLKSAKNQAEGFYVTSVPFSCSDAESLEYCKEYRQRFNREPQQYGAYAYDIYMHIAHCQEPKPEDFKSCVLAYKPTYPTLTESFGLDKNGDLPKDIDLKIKTVRDGKFVEYK